MWRHLSHAPDWNYNCQTASSENYCTKSCQKNGDQGLLHQMMMEIIHCHAMTTATKPTCIPFCTCMFFFLFFFRYSPQPHHSQGKIQSTEAIVWLSHSLCSRSKRHKCKAIVTALNSLLAVKWKYIAPLISHKNKDSWPTYLNSQTCTSLSIIGKMNSFFVKDFVFTNLFGLFFVVEVTKVNGY